MLLRAALFAATLAASTAFAQAPPAAQSRPCSTFGLEGAVTPKTPALRRDFALRLADCLGHPDPAIRDRLAFETLSRMMRGGELEQQTLEDLRGQLLAQMIDPNASATLRSFAGLTMAEIARTDRIKPWMTALQRQQVVESAELFISGITNYYAFGDVGGYIHAVAHGADLALQLALNPAVTKMQLDGLLRVLAQHVAPKDTSVAYWAGEPDRLARAVVFIAQRQLHSDAEWKAWFDKVMTPAPLKSWDEAFKSEAGIKKRHNVRAFLLSVFATAMTTDDPGVKQLVAPVRESLKFVP